MMYRMLLVDDEPQIRKGLAGIIPWEECGVEIVGEAGDGAEAMALIRRLQPELAIVDICMPNRDGLALLEDARSLPSPPKFIMLSGYDQFDYVRTSMRLGARNYLLKPVDPQELRTTVLESIATIDDERSRKQQFDESMEALRNHTLDRLLTDRIEVRELREKCQLLGITLRCNHMAVGVIRPLFDRGDVALRWIMFDSLAVCTEVLNRVLPAYPAADGEDNIAIILKNEGGALSDKSLLRLLRETAAAVSRKVGVPCLCSLGSPAASFHDLPASYRAALRMLDVQLVWGREDDAASLPADAPLFDPDTLPELFLRGQPEQLDRVVQDFFRRMPQENAAVDPAVLRYHLVELVTAALQAARKCYVPETELVRVKASAYESIRSALTLRALEAQMRTILRGIAAQVRHVDTEGYSPKVQAAVRYVNQHYSDSTLALKTLADRLDVNPAYLGRQFSLETGAFFSDYLNALRVRQAQRLLAATTCRIADIAEQVGFVNIPYFYTIYKKITGERPGDSRASAPEHG